RQTPSPKLGDKVLKSPDWFDEAVGYEIFPRSFYDTNNDGIGDLNGVRQKLDYIQSLGANTIWLTPFYPSTTYHGYDVTDYFKVNPQFGTLDDFKALTAEMKRRNMHLIIDFVANHSSDGHPFFKAAYKNPASRYTQWYHFRDKQNTVYDSFFGVPNLPDWNTDNPEVRDYLFNAALFWLNLGADGLRCDYALGVEAPFWAELRQRVKQRHPNAVILGEVWDGGALTLKRYFEAGFDALFDFPWYLTLTGNPDRNGDGVLNGKQPANLLQTPYRLMQRAYPHGAQLVRFSSNHDTNRIASDSLGDPRRMRLAAAAALLTPGVPMIYYGEEIGMRGNKGEGPVYDELRREPMDWYANENGVGMPRWFKPANRHNAPNDGVSVQEQDGKPDSLLSFYRRLGQLRAQYPSLRSREFSVVENVGDCDQCLAIWRHSPNEATLLVFNFSDTAQNIPFDPATAPVPEQAKPKAVLGELSPNLSQLLLAPWGMLAVVWAK
ncbi:MAG: alpha-amylase family glycosyl hydrolase, partial [Anaerolineae bacterium]|nr:alpha-amylase family glycosyl hydrolase [Anaerolineae bacterium]